MEYKAIIKGERIEILVNNAHYRSIVNGTTIYEHNRVVFIDLETGSSLSIANENVIIEMYKKNIVTITECYKYKINHEWNKRYNNE